MRIAIIGGGGHGSVIADIIEKLPQFILVGFLDARYEPGLQILGYEVLGTPETLPLQIRKHDIQGIVIAVGDNWTRSKLAQAVRATAPEIQFPTLIHPSAQIGKNVRLGQGTVVMAGAVVNSNSTTGEFCILNTRCSLDHDNHLGDFVSSLQKVAPGEPQSSEIIPPSVSEQM